MNEQQFHDLKIEQLSDGTVRMTQRYDGNEAIIYAHVAQVIHIARALRGDTNRWPRGFLNRLERLHLQMVELVDMLAAVPCFPPSDTPSEDVRQAMALMDAFDDFLVYFEILPPKDEQDALTRTPRVSASVPRDNQGAGDAN